VAESPCVCPVCGGILKLSDRICGACGAKTYTLCPFCGRETFILGNCRHCRKSLYVVCPREDCRKLQIISGDRRCISCGEKLLEK